MIKFGPNFCYCAVYQEKSVFKGNGPFLARLPFSGLEGPSEKACRKRLQGLPSGGSCWELLRISRPHSSCHFLVLRFVSRGASGRPLGGRGALKRTIWRMVWCLTVTRQRPAGLTAWDWELCRPPEGFRLQSCLACRFRRVRRARRLGAHSV